MYFTLLKKHIEDGLTLDEFKRGYPTMKEDIAELIYNDAKNGTDSTLA